MSLLFFGGELTDFSPATSDTFEDATAGNFNSTFARCAVRVNQYLSYGDSPNFGAQTDFWFRGDCKVTSMASTRQIYGFLNNAGTEVFRVTVSGSPATTTLQMQYLLLGVWTNIGSSISLGLSSVQTFDLNVFVDAAGYAKLYVGGTERISATGIDLTGISDIAQIRLRSPNEAYHSQIIAADEPTIGMRLLTRYPNGTGATADWTGGYTDIDEIVTSDADFINSATANQVELVTQTGPTITGYVVRAVGVSARAKRGASGPANLQLALRSAGTNYFSGNKALTVAYAPYQNIWAQNPATGPADWVNTAIDALQPGVKSIT